MSEPKFAIGDCVAVCTLELNVVIPQTVVTERRWSTHPFADLNGRRVPAPPRWIYRVEHHMRWLNEKTLRPIDPDEYTEPTTESREVSA